MDDVVDETDELSLNQQVCLAELRALGGRATTFDIYFSLLDQGRAEGLTMVLIAGAMRGLTRRRFITSSNSEPWTRWGEAIYELRV